MKPTVGLILKMVKYKSFQGSNDRSMQPLVSLPEATGGLMYVTKQCHLVARKDMLDASFTWFYIT